MSDKRQRAFVFAEIALIWLVFFFHAGWPVPDPNEPHYLTKAKHFWDTDWLAGDLFLESPGAHQLFFLLFGWPTLWVPLPVLAWIGRILTWLLLAFSWQRLSLCLVPKRGVAVLTSALFVALNERGQMAGEWVVGGFEAKGIAYALVFLGLESVLRNRWNVAWLWLGAASAFHVLVGGWTVVACLFAWGVSKRDSAPSIVRILPGLVGGLLLALPGIVPSLMLTAGVEPNTTQHANLVYMERLNHHLDILSFNPSFIAWHLGLLAVWIFLCAIPAQDDRQVRLRRIVSGVIYIALAGAVISIFTQGDRQLAAGLLRFYWFRLTDVFLPLGLALLGVSRIIASRNKLLLVIVSLLAGLHVLDTLERPFSYRPRADKPGKVANYEDWLDVCRWIRENTPRDAIFFTPRSSQTFKWYAERSEIATWKDIPQNPRGLVEWDRRMHEVFDDPNPYATRPFHTQPAGLDRERLQTLSAKYGARYVVAENEDPAGLPALYSNNTYAVYRIPMDEVNGARQGM